MSKDYHGPKPVTKTDVSMARKHLKVTMALEKKKVAEHQVAKRNTSNPKSKAYNQAHIKAHQQDIKQRQTSLKTISKLHPV